MAASIPDFDFDKCLFQNGGSVGQAWFSAAPTAPIDDESTAAREKSIWFGYSLLHGQLCLCRRLCRSIASCAVYARSLCPRPDYMPSKLRAVCRKSIAWRLDRGPSVTDAFVSRGTFTDVGILIDEFVEEF